MSLGPNIARNAALRENVFMIAICIELRIPLFLVGKPGSSKSLAKSIVQTSMQGTASNSELLRGFKQVGVDILYKVGQSWIANKPNSSLGIINKAHGHDDTIENFGLFALSVEATGINRYQVEEAVLAQNFCQSKVVLP